MENLLKEIIANNAIEYNKEESQDRAFIYVDDFINELKSKFKLLNLHSVSNNEVAVCRCEHSSWNRDAGCMVCDNCGKRI